MEITEGATGTVPAGTELKYPGITSCLAITTVKGDVRYGGHAVLVPVQGQLALPAIVTFLREQANTTKLFIIGDIGTWNENWEHLPPVEINGTTTTSVQSMATAMGYSVAQGNLVLFDINTWGTASYDIYFEGNAQRELYAQRGQQAQKYLVPTASAW
jgi:hypothetical protein